MTSLRSIMKKGTTGEGRANKRQRESCSQTDEELTEDIARGGHCCEASAKLAELNVKIDKVLQAVSELDDIKQQ